MDGLRAQRGHAFQVPRQAHQGPFVLDIRQPAQQELAETHHRLGDPEYRLHRLLAQCIGRAPGLGLESVLHVLDRAGRLLQRCRLALAPVPMVGVPANGKQWLDPGGLTDFDVLFTEVAGIAQQLPRLVQPLGERLELGQHRRDLFLVVARLGHMRRHDQHGFAIDQRLGVVALLEAAPGHLHDARVFVGQIDLFVRVRADLRRLRRLAAGFLATGLALGQLGLILGLLPLEAFPGPRFDLGLGLCDSGQTVFAPLELVGQADPAGRSLWSAASARSSISWTSAISWASIFSVWP